MPYCVVNNAEHAPEVSNELITVFLEEYDVGLDRNRSIDLT